ncbi:MAG: hypothetical protein JSR33_02355 [Proteobacteria bacterium]|nr:hypothetical protein [Pseudomonadota bacterium]
MRNRKGNSYGGSLKMFPSNDDSKEISAGLIELPEVSKFQPEQKLTPLEILNKELQNPPVAIFAGTSRNKLITFNSAVNMYYLVYKDWQIGTLANQEIQQKYKIKAAPADYSIVQMIAPEYACEPQFGGKLAVPNKKIYILRYMRKDLVKIIDPALLDKIPAYTPPPAASADSLSSSSSCASSATSI